MQRSICESHFFPSKLFRKCPERHQIFCFPLGHGHGFALAESAFLLFLKSSRKTILFTELSSLVIHQRLMR